MSLLTTKAGRNANRPRLIPAGALMAEHQVSYRPRQPGRTLQAGVGGRVRLAPLRQGRLWRAARTLFAGWLG